MVQVKNYHYLAVVSVVSIFVPTFIKPILGLTKDAEQTRLPQASDNFFLLVG